MTPTNVFLLYLHTTLGSTDGAEYHLNLECEGKLAPILPPMDSYFSY